MAKKVVTFGEIMGRIAPPNFFRFTQALPGKLDFTFGGGEANVAVSVAVLGAESAFVTALPKNAIAEACIMNLRSMGVNARHILRTDNGRFGLYYLETGANQRGSSVTYDRENSAISLTPAGCYNWKDIFADAGWFHITGITPAISAETAKAALEAVKSAKDSGLTVSCDLNFRKKLWRWQPETAPRELAEKTMRGILPYVDVVIANEEDAEKVLSIKAAGTDVEAGELNVDAYKEVARQIVQQFGNVSKVAITLRESISATHNNWGAMLYDANAGDAFFAPLDADGKYSPYQIRHIIDRVGGGDSFAAGLIFALITPELSDTQNAIQFATASSCLKHSLQGDFNHMTRPEVEALMKGQASGRVSR